MLSSFLIEHEQFPSGYFQHVTGGGKSAQLRLFDLDERDFGTYTCRAVNNFGSAVKEFRVVRAGESAGDAKAHSLHRIFFFF